MVKEGSFREDLYYRLNVIPVRLPPLRDRKDDLPLLSQHFVRRSCEANGLAAKTLTQETLRALMNYSWPGNIRQLENAVEHAVAMSGTGAELGVPQLPDEIRRPLESHAMPSMTIPDEGLRCLEKTGGNKRQAARLLQLSRTTLIDKLRRFKVGGDTQAA
ncbi:MAG: hypothetical protein DMF90_06045 [Acidobacteria bacterium]|nr:MAG: hypothetical protein DMF90_06045 [Acidobacteriota bacterium]